MGYRVSFLVSCCFFLAKGCGINEFIKNNTCLPCGRHSQSSNDSYTCPCLQRTVRFVRYYDQRFEYEKDCYRLPNEPLNITYEISSATNVTFRWQKPGITDNQLRTRYQIGPVECNAHNSCRILPWMKNINELHFAKNDLKPNTLYNVRVCSTNDVTFTLQPLQMYCAEKISIRTWKLAPSSILRSSFVHAMDGEKLLVYFHLPETFGTDSIQINLRCGNIPNLTRTYQADGISKSLQSFTLDSGCDESLILCTIQASNELGFGTPVKKYFQLNCEPAATTNILVIAVVCVLVLVVLIALAVFMRWKLKQKKQEKIWLNQIQLADLESSNQRNQYVGNLDLERLFENVASVDNDGVEVEDLYLISDDYNYEFPRRNLNILKRLGQGNFANVYKAEATNIAGTVGKSFVATKVLKDGVTEKDILDVENEMQLMKRLNHPNIVKLLGCCGESAGLIIIVEYLSGGDLLGFLRLSRDNPNKALNDRTMLKFAYHIALGMQHIAEQNIVHRDLACRNILLSTALVCKIADMGLARELDGNGVWHTEPDARLPVKWLAPESIFKKYSSGKSDVWSFGIVLWEIVTVGGSPYPGYTSKQVVPLIREHYKMSKPDNCSNEIYEVMMRCWEYHECERPSFLNLSENIYKMYFNKQHNYMNLEQYTDDMYIAFNNTEDDVIPLEDQ